jgi:streptogramin lyase
MNRGRFAERAFALIFTTVLAGCGGGGGHVAATTPAVTKTASPQGTGKVQFSIVVPPPKTGQSKSRSPKFVSPATKSVSVAIAGTTTNIDVASVSPGCVSDYTHPAISEIGVGQEPRGIILGPDGDMYVVEDGGTGLGQVTPSGAFSDANTGRLQQPVVIGGDGEFWIGDVFSNTIGHMSFDRQTYNEFSGFPGDFNSMALAPDNTIWYTVITTTPKNVLYHVGADGTWLSGDTITLQDPAWDVIQGPDGAMWATESYGTTGFVARVAKVGGAWTLTNEFPFPGNAYAVTTGSDHALWISDNGDGKVSRMTTGGIVTGQYQASPGATRGIALGPDGAVWVTEYDANAVARVTTSGAVTEFTPPSPESSPFAIANGSDGAVYFTERTTSQAGRIQFPVACTSSTAVPAGSAVATVTAYDGLGGAAGSGHPLSLVTVPVTVPLNTTTTVNLVLNGIVSSAGVVAEPFDPLCSSSGSYPLTLIARDISGNVIIGPGGYSDAAGSPLTFTLTTTDTSGRSTLSNAAITAPGSTAPALNWTGGALQRQTINAVVTGGTVPSTVTSATINNNCS